MIVGQDIRFVLREKLFFYWQECQKVREIVHEIRPLNLKERELGRGKTLLSFLGGKKLRICFIRSRVARRLVDFRPLWQLGLSRQ